MKIRNKKKAGVISLAALAGISIIGSSIAYFTSTDTKENPFTVGSVRTELHEDRWDELADTDHNGIPDMAEDIVPNKTIPKDPTIENTGKNPAWVYFEVRVPIVNIITAQADGTRDPKADTELFLFTADLDHWRQLSKTVEEDTDGKKTAVYVFGYESVLDPGQTTTELFSSVTFCNAIEDQGLEDSEQTITVKSMAIQQEETGTMEEAYGDFINQEHVTQAADTTTTEDPVGPMEGQDE
ncbi:SipW-dependent-type signal peptide-containing protein [[Clostridium] innocuum]|nr:SipW-dependent-type signal peptide-containing protein [[Clostridium] innocuum]